MSNKPILSTTADLASSQTAGAPALVMPTGVVLPFAGTAAPTGWLACDGTAISRTTYASLFASIGTSYGVGDGTTTFNLPDFRGRFPRFNDAMFGGSAAGRDTGRVHGSEQADEIKGHTHPTTAPTAGGVNMGRAARPGGNSDGSDWIARAVGHDGANYGSITYNPTQSTGGTETRPINLSINAIIKV